MDKRTVAGRPSIVGDPSALALINELILGIASSINDTLGDDDHGVHPHLLASCILSALGTSYYRLACATVEMTEATPEDRALYAEQNRLAAIEGLHKLCHGLSLVGDVPRVPSPNRLLN